MRARVGGLVAFVHNPRGGRADEPDVNRHTIGRGAEDLAASHLEAEGFRILWRNVRIGPLEIDLVAKQGDLVIIVEVRSRGPTAHQGPLASITWKKRKMLLRACRGVWRGRLKKMPDVHRVRIDVVAITSRPEGPSVEWIRGAIADG